MIYANVERKLQARWWSLVTHAGVGAILPYRLWKMGNERLDVDLEQLEGRARKTLQTFQTWDHSKVFEKMLRDLDEDVDLIMLGSAEYPESLLDLQTPPMFLFVKGDKGLLKSFASAVVGSRKPDREAIRLTDMVVQRKVSRGHTIISGGAIGIDTAAHRSSLQKGGKTIVVAPSGIQALTPSSNRILFSEIVKNEGCIISEYPPLSKPRKFHFHRRNLVLAALSNEVIVVRAAKFSGTLITAKAALKLGKPIYTIPGSPLDPIALGSNQLLQNVDAQYFDFDEPIKIDSSKPRPSLSESELSIYEMLSAPRTIDEISQSLKTMKPNELLSHLTMMELSGYIKKDGRIGAYRRV